MPPSAVVFTVFVVDVVAGVVAFFVVDMVALAMRCCCCCCRCCRLRHCQRHFVDAVIALVVFLGSQPEAFDKNKPRLYCPWRRDEALALGLAILRPKA